MNRDRGLVPYFAALKINSEVMRSFETVFRLDLGDGNTVVFSFASLQQQRGYIEALDTLAKHFYSKSVTEITFPQYELIFMTGNVTDLNRRICVVEANKQINWNLHLLHDQNVAGVQKLYADLRKLGIRLPAQLPSTFKKRR